MADVNTALIDSYLQTLWDREGTDVLIVAGAPPLMRLDGEIVPLDERPLRPEDTPALVRGVLAGELWDDFQHDREIDFSFNWEGQARFRGNAYHQRGSVALSLRLIPYRIPTFADLGLPAVLSSWVDLPAGPGPGDRARPAPGKSTTLAAMIDAVNQRRACHIITIEDPIEYVHRHKKAAISQREIGLDTESFSRALRSALREDPDVLLVGEMRDPETIQTALDDRRDRAPRVRDAAHQRRRPGRRPHRRRVPGRQAVPDPGPARRVADRHRLAAAHAPHRRRSGGGVRGADRPPSRSAT